jgi:transposase
MGKRVSVTLTEEEDRTLRDLHTTTMVPQRVKDRADAVRLVAQGWHVNKIAPYLNWSIKAVRAAIQRWNQQGLRGLWDQPRSGRPATLTQEDIVCVEQWLREDERTYNAKQLAKRLKEERNVDITADHLREVLKARGICWKRTRHSHKQRQDPELKQLKQEQLDILKEMNANGEIDLYYADESGCDPWSDPSYSYFFKGEQKRQEQTPKRGKRVNIIGFFQSLVTFFYTMVVGGVNSETFIQVMNEQAKQAEKVLENEGKIRVIGIDNASFHTSKAVRACWERWRLQGLFVFFFPPYCSEMNRIETEWLHLKRDELAGRMFNDEKELAVAIAEGFEARAEKNGHTIEVFCLA